MATLETQYRNYMEENPHSEFTFEQWKEYHSRMLVQSLKPIMYDLIRINEIYRDKGALEQLDNHLDQLTIPETEKELFAIAFAMGIEYARNNQKIKSINEIEQNPNPSVYGC